MHQTIITTLSFSLLLFMDIRAQNNEALPRGGEGTEIKIYDGAGNKHIITAALYEYYPVQPAQSSGGNYSGGKKSTFGFPYEQEQRFRELIFKAAAAKKQHSAEREKGSWVVYILSNRGKNKQNFILESGSAYIKRLDTILESIRKKEE